MYSNTYSVRTLCPKKNDTDVGHYSFDVHQTILIIFLAEMLPGEKAIKR